MKITYPTRSALCVVAGLLAILVDGSVSAAADPPAQRQTFSLRQSMAQSDGEGDAAASVEEVETFDFGWPGLITGMQGFEKMPLPVSQPLYFEEPFIRTDFRFLYLYHDFPKGSALRGGDLKSYALQIRLALTERLAFIATKDGYSSLRAKVLPDADGWNDFAIGLKYALAYDVQADEEWILTTGFRWEWQNGDEDVLQGDSQELSPFLSYGHRWGKFNLLAALSWRIPMDRHDAVHSLMWDAHFSYELLENFYPLIEFHGLHYLSNADRIPFDIDGLDYTSIGATDVRGDSAYWVGLGFRWHVTPRISAGATYELPLMDADRDIFKERVTVNISYSL